MSNAINAFANNARKYVARAVRHSGTDLISVIRYLKAEDFDNSSAEWAFCLSAGLIMPQSGRYVLSNRGAAARGDY